MSFFEDILKKDEPEPEETGNEGNKPKIKERNTKENGTDKMFLADGERGQIVWMFIKYPIAAFIITLLSSVIPLMMFFGVFKGITSSLIIGIISGIITAIGIYNWARYIPADPPHVGLVTFFGSPRDKVQPPGWFPRIPLLWDIIPVEITKEDQDFKPEELLTKQEENVGMDIVSYLSWSPDYTSGKSLFAFLKAGRTKGVRDILDNLIPDYQRRWLRKLGWKEALSARERLVDEIMHYLVGEKPEDIIAMQKDGKSDVVGLGILLFRYNIGPMKVLGDVGKEIERQVKEEIERQYEVYETGSEVRQALAKIFGRRGKDITMIETEGLEEEIEKIKETDTLKRKKIIERIKAKNLEKAVEEISAKDSGFKDEFDEDMTWVKDYKTVREGVPITPGMRDRLAKGGAIPLDVSAATLSGLLQRSTEIKPDRSDKKKPEKTS